ncbi:MAG: MFS transporter [Acidimicrobiales bacterium]
MALASLRPLRSRNFALIWSAALVSNLGSWMQTIALGVLVFSRTGRPAWAGLVAAAGFVPIGLLAPLGGALADRLDRRRWLIATTLGETSFAVVLAVLAGFHHDPPWVLVVLSFLGGASGAIGFPAYQAIVPDLVPQEDILAAVSLSSAQYNLGRVLGPALAGIVLLTQNYAVVFGINAASFGAVVVALVMVRLPKPLPRRDDLSMAGRIAEGARAARAEPGCRSAIICIAVVALLASPFIALVPAMAHTVRPAGWSLGLTTAALVTAQGVGAVAGALALPSLAFRFGRLPVLRTALVAVPVLLCAYAAAPTLALAVPAFVAVGAAYICVLSGLNTVVQLHAPPAVRGRILSIYMMALGLVYPLGAVVQGWAADAHGVRAVTAVGALILLAAVVLARLFRPTVLADLADPLDEEGPVEAGPGIPVAGDPAGAAGAA